MYRIFDINNLTDEQYGKYFSMMSKSRKEKVETLKDIKAKKRTVAGEMLVRQMLSEDILIEVGENGKPYTDGAYFNISHKENLVVCAVSDKPIGIDIEKIMPYNERLCRRITSQEEYDYINQNGERLTEIWTLKEAIIKKDGKSILSVKNIDALAEKNKQKYVYKDFIIHVVF